MKKFKKIVEEFIFLLPYVMFILLGMSMSLKKHPCAIYTTRLGCVTHEEYNKMMNEAEEKVRMMSEEEKLQILLAKKEQLLAQRRSIRTRLELRWINSYISELKILINKENDE